MKALSPFSKTFFSEWFLSPEREGLLDDVFKRKPVDPNVGELITLDDKGKEKDEGEREFTTESETGQGFHGGL